MACSKPIEEMFKCSSLDGDNFLAALEHQNFYVAPEQQLNDSDHSHIENLIMYYEMEKPAKGLYNGNGKVAAVIASLKLKSAGNKSSTRKLRHQKKNGSVLLPEERAANIMELKNTYESQSNKHKIPTMVKETAQVFNSKVKVIRRNFETSKPPKSNSSQPSVFTVGSFAKPKHRAKLPIYRIPFPSPLPSARLRCKQYLSKPKSPVLAQQQEHNACLIAEELFRGLSVKDKILLFNKLISDMSQKYPMFIDHVDDIKESIKTNMACGEVVIEKQATVKFLAKELEAKCTSSPSRKKIIQNNHRRKRQASQPPTPKSEETEHSSSQSKKIVEKDLHISTLTVILKPSLDTKENGDLEVPSSSPEPYVPPMKIQRRLPKCFENTSYFKDTQQDTFFNSYVKKKIGELFNTTSIPNIENNINSNIMHSLIERPNSTEEETQKSELNQPLEEAIAKLEESKVKESSCIEEKMPNTTSEVAKTMPELPISNTTETLVEIQENNSIEVKVIITTPDVTNTLPELPISNVTDNLSDKETLVEIKENSSIDIKVLNTTPDVTNTLPELPIPNTTYNLSVKETLVEIPPPLEVLLPPNVNDIPVETPIVKRQAPPVPSLTPVPALRSSLTTSLCVSSTNLSAKQYDIDSESGVSTLPKNTSDESPLQSLNGKASVESMEQVCEFAAPVNRKRKCRRQLIRENKNSIVKTVKSTTDSDSEGKKAAQAEAEAPIKHKPFTLAKKFIQKKFSNWSHKKSKKQEPVEQSITELNKSVIHQVNSPQKVESAYALTVLSTPSLNIQTDLESTPHKPIQEKCPTSLDDTEKFENKRKRTMTPQKEPAIYNNISIDQGFETDSNKIDSPKIYRNKITEAMDEHIKYRNSTPFFTKTSHNISKMQENHIVFSTPVRGHMQQTFTGNNGAMNQFKSPKTNPMKNRRRSMYDADFRRSSVAMQVICEDEPLNLDRMSLNSHFLTDSVSFTNATSKERPSNISNFGSKTINNEQSSTYWITAGDVTVSIDIYYCPPHNLRIFHNMFMDKCLGKKEICIGIDRTIFMVPNSNNEIIKDQLTYANCTVKGMSHYWFGNRGITVPFTGKYMPMEKIEHLFNFIEKSCNGDASKLHFGLDHFDFSIIPEFWDNTPKFSFGSSYSMLVGLQSGNSNGLEGRSKYAWPNSKPDSANLIRTSDLCRSIEKDSISSRPSKLQKDSISSDMNLNSTNDPANQNEAASPKQIERHSIIFCKQILDIPETIV